MKIVRSVCLLYAMNGVFACDKMQAWLNSAHEYGCPITLADGWNSEQRDLP
jgi:hypothetical protein